MMLLNARNQNKIRNTSKRMGNGHNYVFASYLSNVCESSEKRISFGTIQSRFKNMYNRFTPEMVSIFVDDTTELYRCRENKSFRLLPLKWHQKYHTHIDPMPYASLLTNARVSIFRNPSSSSFIKHDRNTFSATIINKSTSLICVKF